MFRKGSARHWKQDDFSQHEQNGKGQILWMAESLQESQKLLQSKMGQRCTYELTGGGFTVVINTLLWKPVPEYSDSEFPGHTTVLRS